MEKDSIMCESVQNSPKAGDPAPDSCLFLELLKAIAYYVGREARRLDDQSQWWLSRL